MSPAGKVSLTSVRPAEAPVSAAEPAAGAAESPRKVTPIKRRRVSTRQPRRSGGSATDEGAAAGVSDGASDAEGSAAPALRQARRSPAQPISTHAPPAEESGPSRSVCRPPSVETAAGDVDVISAHAAAHTSPLRSGLRRRNAAAVPPRTRPTLVSSTLGRAREDERRRREAEANAAFLDAQEVLERAGKPDASSSYGSPSSSRRSQTEQLAERHDEPAREADEPRRDAPVPSSSETSALAPIQREASPQKSGSSTKRSEPKILAPDSSPLSSPASSSKRRKMAMSAQPGAASSSRASSAEASSPARPMSPDSEADEADAAERELGLAPVASSAGDEAAKDGDAAEEMPAPPATASAEALPQAAVEGEAAAELAPAPMLLDEPEPATGLAAAEPPAHAVSAEAPGSSTDLGGERAAGLETTTRPQAPPAAEAASPSRSVAGSSAQAADGQREPAEGSQDGQPGVVAPQAGSSAAATEEAVPDAVATETTALEAVPSVAAADTLLDVVAGDAPSMLARPVGPSSSPTARAGTSRASSPGPPSSATAPTSSSAAVVAPAVAHIADDLSQTAPGSAPAMATSSAAQAEQSPQHAELLDGLDSQDFDDLMLSPEAARRPAARAAAVHESPAVVARAFQRTRSGKQPKPPGASYDSDDEFAGEDSELFAELAGGDFDASFEDAIGAPTPAIGNGAVPPMVGFQNGRGEKLKAPSEAALKAARSRFWDVPEDEEDVPSTPSRVASPAVCEPAAARPSTFTSGHLERTRTPLGRLPHDNVSGSPRQDPHDALNGAGKQPTATAPRAFETPLRTSTLARPQATPLPRASLSSGATPTAPQRTGSHLLSTPASNSTRVALGVTPRVAAARSVARPKFATPFKTAPRASANALPTQDSPSAAAFSSPLKPSAGPSHVGLASGRKRMPAADVFKVPAASARAPYSVVGSEQSGRLRKPVISGGPAVFDLSKPRNERKSMQAYGLRPESVSAAAVYADFDEIPVILNTPSRSLEFEFDTPSGDAFGPPQALEYLHSKGAVHVDARWVRNHWLLILWKLAALTRLRPDDYSWRFSSEEVCRQLLYRYEREVNLAQRSAIKRIQEHDSSPGQSMVLCVMAIPTALEEDETPFVELTDGWYRIRATIDKALHRAVQRERIKVGSKLAISGARLNGSSEPSEVLQALELSALCLEGNAVKLARWDARLGFAPRPFVATLRSLTPDGGLVPCMDIVLTRVYPLAFVDERERGGGEDMSNARGEAQEAEEEEKWHVQQADVRARIEAKYEQSERTLEQLSSMLYSLASGMDAGVSQSYATASQCEDFLDTLLASSDPQRDAARIPPSSLPAVAQLAAERSQRSRDEMRSQMEAELATACAPRRSRDFRVVRFEDAATGPGGTWQGRRPRGQRSVQLTVWDVSKLGEQGLQEGKRYIVTNLRPTQLRSWRKPDDAADVFLSTRRDTTWQLVE